MKNKNEEIDQIIKDSLSKEEAQFYNELEEQNLIGKIGGVFKGKLGWLIAIMNILSLVAFAIFVYCSIQFIESNTINELMRWGAGGFYSMLFICMIKIYFWQEMHKNALLRELKRLELQIALNSSKQVEK